MKKAVIVLIVLFLCIAGVYADILGVQIIDTTSSDPDTVSIDNLAVGKEVEITDYAIITPTEFGYFDSLGYYNKGQKNIATDSGMGGGYYYSENDADFAILRCDLTNLSLKARDFLKACTVTVVYDKKYKFDGWFYQSNYNNNGWNSGHYYWILEEDRGNQNKRYAINSADQFAINPMYTGHYIFGCTLPNAVINSTKPLKMVITLDGNEITYHIRK